jgi:predicted RNase H-like HicB family nuclease
MSISSWLRCAPSCLNATATYLGLVQYHVVLVETNEGFAVSCPALPGCHSQGSTRDEALAAIREAIVLWLEVAEEDEVRGWEEAGARVEREIVTV